MGPLFRGPFLLLEPWFATIDRSYIEIFYPIPVLLVR